MCEELLVPKQCVRKPRVSKVNEFANANEGSRSKVARAGSRELEGREVNESRSRGEKRERSKRCERYELAIASSDVRDQR